MKQIRDLPGDFPGFPFMIAIHIFIGLKIEYTDKEWGDCQLSVL
jgi:hypothetical protein